MARRQNSAGLVTIAAAFVLLASSFLVAQSADSSSLVEVYWNSSRSTVIPGVTSLVLMDENVARVERTGDIVQVYGLERGETVLLAFVQGKPVSFRVRVIERPQVPISPSLLRQQAEMGHGIFTTGFQTMDTGTSSTFVASQGTFWSQPMGDRGRFEFSSTAEDGNITSGHSFNLRNASATYSDPAKQIHLFDFTVNLMNPAEPGQVSVSTFSDTIDLRGAKVVLIRDRNRYSMYAGTSLPYHYLTLGNTRDLAGFSWERRHSRELSLFANTTYVNAPVNYFTLDSERRNSIMQTTGFTWLPDSKWSVSASGGASNHGGLLRGMATYSTPGLTAFAGGSTSAAMFPMNQIHSLFTGGSTIRAGVVRQSNNWLSESIYYQRSTSRPVSGILQGGSSQYLSPGIGLRLSARQNASLTYTYSRSEGGFQSSTSSSNRLDGNWSWQIADRVINATQFAVGAVQDRLQLHSEDQFSIRNSLQFPVGSNQMFVGASFDRADPSLVQKLNAELNLLSPALKNLFLNDPIAFVNSANLPPELRALLEAQHPASVSAFASGNFYLGKRLTLNPSFSVSKMTGLTSSSWTPFVGYGLQYQLLPSLQISSGLNNVWAFNSNHVSERTTVFSFGLVKTFRAAPDIFSLRHGGRVVEGRVYRDNNVNGVFNAGEPGFAGVEVRLENGEAAITDEQGHFKFTGVSSGAHRVTLNIVQFRNPIKMTTASDTEIDLIRNKRGAANFGIIDFARVMGTVFNDLRFQDKLQPDSKGMQRIEITLQGDKIKRTATTDSSGQFEITDVPPGDYTVTLDTQSLPANYVAPAESFTVHVNPVSTTLRDVPVRALRSISGRVFLRTPRVQPNGTATPAPLQGSLPRKQAGRPVHPGGSSRTDTPPASETNGTVAYDMIPVEGIQISAGYGIVKTDANGNFLIRNLPAGDLVVTLVPVRPVPAGMNVPSGRVHMPAEPVQVQGASIVISNPELMPYLVGRTVEEIRQLAPPMAPPTPLQTATGGVAHGGRP